MQINSWRVPTLQALGLVTSVKGLSTISVPDVLAQNSAQRTMVA